MSHFFQTLFTVDDDYYTSVLMIDSLLKKSESILLLKRPLTHYWTSPLNLVWVGLTQVWFDIGRTHILHTP